MTRIQRSIELSNSQPVKEALDASSGPCYRLKGHISASSFLSLLLPLLACPFLLLHQVGSCKKWWQVSLSSAGLPISPCIGPCIGPYTGPCTGPYTSPYIGPYTGLVPALVLAFILALVLYQLLFVQGKLVNTF